MSQMQMIPSTNVMVPSRNPARPAAGPAQNLSAHFVLDTLRLWWKVALPVGLSLAALGAAAVYLLFKPVYEAAAWFKIDERAPYLAFESKDDGRSKQFFQTQIEMIRSPLVLGSVIARPEIAGQPEITRQADKVAWLGKQIKVTSVGESELFRLLYTASDPKNAAAVINAITESYFKLRDQSESERNQRIIELLSQEQERRSKEVMRLRENLRSLAKDVSDTDPFGGKTQQSQSPQKYPLADLEGRLITVQVERTMLEARIKAAEDELASQNKASDSSPGSLGGMASKQEVSMRDAMADKAIEDNPVAQRQKQLIVERRTLLTANLQRAAKGKLPASYQWLADEIKGEEEVLDQLRAEMKPKALRYAELTLASRGTGGIGTGLAHDRRIEELAKLRSDREGARVMEQMLRARYEEQRKKIEQCSGETMELGFRRDELVRAEKVFELIAQRTLQLQTERGAPARVTLMQAAEPPATPVEVFPYRNILLTTLVCFCLPFALAVGWERLIGRVGDTRSLEWQSNVSVLGEIAQLPVRTPVARSSASARIKQDLRLFEESIDSLRTSLALSEKFGNLRVLAVTSASNHEGKTSVVSQLAMSFTRATGQPVLLIDGDMRCPDIHNVFGVPLEPGLAKVLSGECSLEEAIVTTGDDLVHLLPAGRLEASPHSLLGNGAWTSLLAKIPPSYQYVLIDTPPVLPASEALVLAKSADASLVCVMRDVSRTDQIRRVIDRLATTGGNPVGLVFNGVPTRGYSYSYRWGDYRYSG